VTSDIYVLKLIDDSVKKIVDQPGPDNNPRYSPDDKQIVFSSAMGEKVFFASNSRLAVVSAQGGPPKSITDSFDESPGLIEWKADGIYFAGSEKTASHLFRVDPASARITRISQPDNLMAGSFSFTAPDRLAFTVASPASISEVFVSTCRLRRANSPTSTSNERLYPRHTQLPWKVGWCIVEGVLIAGEL
jgi:dipeptidyl aminopeptidase/acylaminoacyl peptidase